MSFSLFGIGIGNGIAIGRAHVLHREVPEVPEYRIHASQIDAEIERYQAAVHASRLELKAVAEQIPADTSQDVSDFIDAHMLMLQDAALVDAPINTIRQQQRNAEWALKRQCDLLCQVFDEMDDPYLRTRRNDVAHVVTGIQRQLLLSGQPDEAGQWGEHLHGHIIIADDLTPADIILLNNQGISGFITEHGGPLSHSAILAKNLSIPALIGVNAARNLLAEDELLVIDAAHGVLNIAPDELSLDQFRARLDHWQQHRIGLQRLTDQATISQDQQAVQLLSNIELASEADASLQVGADGVGLYRTEFMFMNRETPPNEQEHLDNYLSALSQLQGQSLTIRTLDLGADKPIPGERSVTTNPALGLRAIRLCLREPGLFIPQLRAILRASAHGPVRILLPMISTLREIQQARQIIQQIGEQLRQQGHRIADNIPIGGMIEVPAAALAIDQLAPHLDFLSIGTNDLIQYTLAIDRVDDEVTYLYDPLHSAVLKLIQGIIDAGQRHQKRVCLCGEMAADTRLTRLLLAMGLREFSMHPANILEVKAIIRDTHIAPLKPLAQQIINSIDPQQQQQQLEQLNQQ